MNYLSENIKNIGTRIKQLDKKIEKKVGPQLIQKLKDQAQAINSPEDLVNEVKFREAYHIFLNATMAKLEIYLGLPFEDWALRIMQNLVEMNRESVG